jgi:hypothetical protein
MPLVTPSWFKQRQGKADPAGDNTFCLTAPNLGEAFLSVRRADNGLLLAALKLQADGPDIAATEPVFEHDHDAWEAAFELYRAHVVV